MRVAAGDKVRGTRLGKVDSLHDIRLRLSAWLGERHHKRAHASVVGLSPATAWKERQSRHIPERALEEALTLHARRRVRTDSTLSVGGIDWDVDECFSAGRFVTVARTLADVHAAPWVELDDAVYRLHPVDPVANGKLRKRRPKKPGIDAVDFDPASVALDVNLCRKKGGVQ